LKDGIKTGICSHRHKLITKIVLLVLDCSSNMEDSLMNLKSTEKKMMPDFL